MADETTQRSPSKISNFPTDKKASYFSSSPPLWIAASLSSSFSDELAADSAPSVATAANSLPSATKMYKKRRLLFCKLPGGRVGARPPFLLTKRGAPLLILLFVLLLSFCGHSLQRKKCRRLSRPLLVPTLSRSFSSPPLLK